MYFKDNNNQVFWYDDDQIELAQDKTLMTEEEIELHLNPIKTQEQIKAEISSAIQSMLDSKAQELRYDNINSIAKYIGYDNPFRTEAEALGLWCASCWAELAIIEEEVESGERVLPSLEEILAELPEFSV